MRVCDKCRVVDTFHTIYEVVIVLEDQHFELCERHMDELMKFLTTEEKLRKKRKIL